MIDGLYEVLKAGGASAFGAMLTCMVMSHLWKQLEEHRKKIEEDLENERQLRVKKLETGISALDEALREHIAGDKPEVTKEDLGEIRAQLQRLEDVQARMQEKVGLDMVSLGSTLGEIKGVLQGIQTQLQDTSKSVQSHVTNMEIHHQ